MLNKNNIYINTYKYLKAGLTFSNPKETKSDIYKKIFLVLLHDYYQNKIPLTEAAQVAHELYQLEYFSFDLTTEDPDLFSVFDILGFIALKDPKTKLMDHVESYYKNNYSKIMNGLSGDLKVDLK